MKPLTLALILGLFLGKASFGTSLVINTLDNDHSYSLTKYSSNFYNTLPTVEKADSLLKKRGDFEEFLIEARSRIENEQLRELLGFRLVHRHNTLASNQKMVERFGFSSENLPFFVTRPENINIEDNVPASWLVTDKGLLVFEYSTDPDVINFISTTYGSTLIKELSEAVLRYDLEELMAPSVLKRQNFEHFQHYGIKQKKLFQPLEHSEEIHNTHANVVLPKLPQLDIKNIQTTWHLFLAKEVGCQPVWGCSGESVCAIISTGHENRGRTHQRRPIGHQPSQNEPNK
jgi:hypothetical protein